MAGPPIIWWPLGKNIFDELEAKMTRQQEGSLVEDQSCSSTSSAHSQVAQLDSGLGGEEFRNARVSLDFSLAQPAMLYEIHFTVSQLPVYPFVCSVKMNVGASKCHLNQLAQ